MCVSAHIRSRTIRSTGSDLSPELASDYGFRLRACRPYRAKTKGKVERFNGYLKHSFITPLAATLKQAGLTSDVETANAQIGPWLEDVANQRILGTTKQTPATLLIKEQLALASLPLKSLSNKPSPRISSRSAVPVESFQHPLSVYDQLLRTQPWTCKWSEYNKLVTA